MAFSNSNNEKKRRGCLFCIMGQEAQTASLVEVLWPGVKAYPVSAAKRRSKNGVKSVGVEVIIPSYVFFETYEDFMPASPFPDGVIRVLTTVDGSWWLTGRDDEFARWLFENGGVLNLSQAHKEGDRIVIHQGPLKDLEGYITRIDKRNENGLVQLNVGGNQIRIWLPFEIIEK